MPVMLGRKVYAARLGRPGSSRDLVTSIGAAAVRLRYDEDALRRILGADQRILRLRVEPDGAGEFAVVDPLPQHELVLVLDVRVDELEEHPALDPVIGLRRVVGRPVRQTATDEPMRVVAAAGQPLTGDRLTPRVDTADVRADRTGDSPRVTRSVGLHVPEVVEPLGRDASPRGCPCPATGRAARRCASGP